MMMISQAVGQSQMKSSFTNLGSWVLCPQTALEGCEYVDLPEPGSVVDDKYR